MTHTKAAKTIATIAELFKQVWAITVGLSGKDSFCVSHCAIEALKEARITHPNAGPLYLVTTNTSIDNFEVHSYVLSLHEAATAYGREQGLPIESVELMPALSSRPMVEYLGRGKLLRTPQTSSNGRDCTVDWKIEPMKKFLKQLQQKHQTTKILSLSGTRDDESSIRAANIKKRGETISAVSKTELGYTLAPIKDWDLNDVWRLVNLIDDGEIESYAEDDTAGLRKHYSAGNGGTCDLFAGTNKKADKSCGSRFGCTLCSLVPEDTSLQNQIDTDPATYGYMSGFVKLRKFMLDTLYDYERSRSLLGRKVSKEGYIKVGYNHYSIAYRHELLGYVLTMDALEQERAEEAEEDIKFQLVDYTTLIAIQYHWSREGGERTPGEALQLWHQVHTHGKRFSIPETNSVPAQPLELQYGSLSFIGGTDFKKYRYLHIEDTFLQSQFDPHAYGLNLIGLGSTRHEKETMPNHRIYDQGTPVLTTPFYEAKRFEVDTEGGAWEYVEGIFPQLVERGLTDANNEVDPTVILKDLLQRGTIKIKQGSARLLHNEMKRAQLFNAMRRCGQYHETICLAHSIDAKTHEARIAEPVADDMLPQLALAI